MAANQPWLGKSVRRGRKALLPGALAAFILLMAWVLGHLGGSGGGGSGSGAAGADSARSMAAQATTQPVAKGAEGQSHLPQATIDVIIHGDQYWVGGKALPLGQIIAAAKQGVFDGPAVKVVSEPDSRMGTERELENALDAAHLPWVLETEPGEGT